MDFLNFKAELTLVFFVALSGFCLPGPTDAMNVTICSDDYIFFNHIMICPRLQQIKIIEVWENFVWQGTRPECTDTPAHRESYKFPFVRDCEGKDNCIISSTFLETNGLFSAATYILPDAHLYNIPIRIDIQYECINIQKEKHICYDDLMWSDEADLGFVLDCVYPNITGIRLLEASAVFTVRLTPSYWTDSRYDRPDCETQIAAWNVLQLNYTYSTQVNCDTNFIPILDPNAGVFCRITKSHLWVNVFRTHEEIIAAGKVFFPFPYGFLMRYTCF